MKKASLRFDRQFVIGAIDGRMKGSFVEHLGRCLYDGLYEPTHPTADAQGFRGDVKELIRELGVSCIRYPGGNFVSGYHWRDGVGPRAQRPARPNLAWNTIETNQVGVDEFAALCRELGVELLMACNLGTGTPEEAGELVEYCRTEGGTSLSELRKANGAEKPHDIHVWCLGNEMDGAWQIGTLNAEDYAKKARETAKIIRWLDPKAELIACGTCTNEQGHVTYGDWDRTVLEAAYQEIDYLSLHRYYNYYTDKQLFYPMTEDFSDIPFFFSDLDHFIDTIVHACDFVKGKLRTNKQVNISFDEWGVVAKTGALPGGVKQEYTSAVYTQLDAVIYGGIICTLLNHADRVKIACQSLLVNEGGMITTVPGGPAYRQATFWPFRDFAHLATGVSLRAVSDVPSVQTNHYGPQPTLITNASYDEAAGRLCVMLANCDLEEDCEVTLRLTDFGPLPAPVRHELYTEDWRVTNTCCEPDAVTPRLAEAPAWRDGALTFTVKKHSWNTLVFTLNP